MPPKHAAASRAISRITHKIRLKFHLQRQQATPGTPNRPPLAARRCPYQRPTAFCSLKRLPLTLESQRQHEPRAFPLERLDGVMSYETSPMTP